MTRNFQGGFRQGGFNRGFDRDFRHRDFDHGFDGFGEFGGSLIGDLQVANSGTRCSQGMNTLRTSIRHMAINHMGITVLIKNENMLNNRFSG